METSCKAAVPLCFRTGTAADAQVMRELVWNERMNPLGITPERFTVAVDDSGKMLGFGQLEQKDGYKELRTMVVNPSCRCRLHKSLQPLYASGSKAQQYVTPGGSLLHSSAMQHVTSSHTSQEHTRMRHAGGRALAEPCWTDCWSRQLVQMCC